MVLSPEEYSAIIYRCRTSSDSFQQIGDDFNVSKQRIHQICNDAGIAKKSARKKRQKCKLPSCNNRRLKQRDYCSDECMKIGMRTIMSDQRKDPSAPGSKFRIVTLICTNPKCGKTFERTGQLDQISKASKQKKGNDNDHAFCCLPCYHEWRRGRSI